MGREMNLRQVDAFRAVMDCGSMTAAARVLGIGLFSFGRQFGRPRRTAASLPYGRRNHPRFQVQNRIIRSGVTGTPLATDISP